jgi:hypothetical protein
MAYLVPELYPNGKQGKGCPLSGGFLLPPDYLIEWSIIYDRTYPVLFTQAVSIDRGGKGTMGSRCSLFT